MFNYLSQCTRHLSFVGYVTAPSASVHLAYKHHDGPLSSSYLSLSSSEDESEEEEEEDTKNEEKDTEGSKTTEADKAPEAGDDGGKVKDETVSGSNQEETDGATNSHESVAAAAAAQVNGEERHLESCQPKCPQKPSLYPVTLFFKMGERLSLILTRHNYFVSTWQRGELARSLLFSFEAFCKRIGIEFRQVCVRFYRFLVVFTHVNSERCFHALDLICILTQRVILILMLLLYHHL